MYSIWILSFFCSHNNYVGQCTLSVCLRRRACKAAIFCPGCLDFLSVCHFCFCLWLVILDNSINITNWETTSNKCLWWELLPFNLKYHFQLCKKDLWGKMLIIFQLHAYIKERKNLLLVLHFFCPFYLKMSRFKEIEKSVSFWILGSCCQRQYTSSFADSH